MQKGKLHTLLNEVANARLQIDKVDKILKTHYQKILDDLALEI